MMIRKIPHWFSQCFCLLAAAGVLAWSGISYSAEPPKVKPINKIPSSG